MPALKTTIKTRARKTISKPKAGLKKTVRRAKPKAAIAPEVEQHGPSLHAHVSTFHTIADLPPLEAESIAPLMPESMDVTEISEESEAVTGLAGIHWHSRLAFYLGIFFGALVVHVLAVMVLTVISV